MVHAQIELDDEATWPSPVLMQLDRNFHHLAAVERERARIDIEARDDVLIRMNPPPNPYTPAREKVLLILRDDLKRYSLLGWHCTRLHEEEIVAIQRDGVQPLQRGHLLARIDARRIAGDIPEEIAARLCAKNEVLDPGREGISWFIFSRRLLHDENGVSRLLRSWGGEALYNSHESDNSTGPILRGIGVPCIVEAVIPIPWIQCRMAERMLISYLERRQISTGDDPSVQGAIAKRIPAVCVRQIIRRNEPQFEGLTGCSAWREVLR